MCCLALTSTTTALWPERKFRKRKDFISDISRLALNNLSKLSKMPLSLRLQNCFSSAISSFTISTKLNGKCQTHIVGLFLGNVLGIRKVCWVLLFQAKKFQADSLPKSNGTIDLGGTRENLWLCNSCFRNQCLCTQLLHCYSRQLCFISQKVIQGEQQLTGVT